RKGVGLKAIQLRLLQLNDPRTPDFLSLSLVTLYNKAFLIVNTYNSSINAARAGQAVRSFISLPRTFFLRLTLIARNFNLYHCRWQPSLDRNFLDFTLTSTADKATHNRGNVLDLAFVNSALEFLGITTELSKDLENSSDHRTLFSTVYWDCRHREPITSFRLATLNKKSFLKSFKEHIEPVQLLRTPQNPTELDIYATKLTVTVPTLVEHVTYCRAARAPSCIYSLLFSSSSSFLSYRFSYDTTVALRICRSTARVVTPTSQIQKVSRPWPCLA
ncbi:hypothetical protein B0O99DRAFT_732872, partial [Bisporella sp. PMI_857]